MRLCKPSKQGNENKIINNIPTLGFVDQAQRLDQEAL